MPSPPSPPSDTAFGTIAGPASSDDLVADGLLKAVPTDPYRRPTADSRLRPKGAVVFSVGSDGGDNGGNIESQAGL